MDSRKPFSEPVLQMVASASDEQLAWIVGPDRRFYSKEAVEAATRELEARRESAVEEDEAPRFNASAFVFGPLWYFYHGMIGRGVLILAVLLGALLGLEPVADAVGIPPLIWVMVVLASVGAYCSRFASRDLRESRIQARLTAHRPVRRRPRQRLTERPRFVVAAEVGCRVAAEQASSLLRAEGIEPVIKSEAATTGDSDSSSSGRAAERAQLLVPEPDLERARSLLAALLTPREDGAQPLCDEPS